MINDNMDEPPVANGKDPLATMYGPVDIELASSVLPELNMMTNNNADAIGGGTSGRAEGGDLFLNEVYIFWYGIGLCLL